MNVNVHLQKYIDKKYLCAGNPHKHLDINKKYKFFIVIPCYNEFDYLFSTLESIDKQNPMIRIQKTDFPLTPLNKHFCLKCYEGVSKTLIHWI